MSVLTCRVPVPKFIADELTGRSGKFTDAKDVFHCIAIGTDHFAGVFGDGGNGCYEWFVWKRMTFECSDKGYGDTVIALRDILNREVI